MDNLTLKVIARIYTDFGEKFGVPRQSGLVPELTGKIIFEPEYRVPEALSEIEGYSWLWLLWGFSESPRNQSRYWNLLLESRIPDSDFLSVYK